MTFCFGFRRPEAASTLRRLHMLGASELPLRRGFASGKTLVRRISAAGQMAGLVVSSHVSAL